MRIAGGVLLLCAALFNLPAGCTYACGGGLAAVAGGAGGALLDRAARERGARHGEVAGARAAGRTLQAAGAGLTAFGLLVLAAAGLQVAGAVQLFRARGRRLVIAVAILTAVVEVGGAMITSFGLTNALGLVAAAIAGAGAASIGRAPVPEPAMPPPRVPPPPPPGPAA